MPYSNVVLLLHYAVPRHLLDLEPHALDLLLLLFDLLILPLRFPHEWLDLRKPLSYRRPGRDVVLHPLQLNLLQLRLHHLDPAPILLDFLANKLLVSLLHVIIEIYYVNRRDQLINLVVLLLLQLQQLLLLPHFPIPRQLQAHDILLIRVVLHVRVQLQLLLVLLDLLVHLLKLLLLLLQLPLSPDHLLLQRYAQVAIILEYFLQSDGVHERFG